MEALIELLRLQPAAFVVTAFLFALLVGSFLNVVIHRLPIMMEREWKAQCAGLAGEEPAETETYNLVVPRSACPGCGHKITALENVPVLSYLALRGRCRGCSKKISLRYPIIETVTALLAAVIAWHFGFGAEALAALALTFALIALTMIDVDTQYLPDSITLPFLWLGLVLSLFHGRVDAQALFVSPRDAIICAAAGYLSLWSVYQAFKLVTGKEGMGFGDFKLLAVLGAWLGWQKLPLVIFLSAVVGAIVGIALMALRRHGRDVPIPFGPYLAAAGWVAMLWGDAIIDGYLHFAGMG